MPEPNTICTRATAFEGSIIRATRPRLPLRFPVGTHYIVEGEPAKGGQPRIVSRYVVLPSGVRYDLMTPAERVRAQACRSRPQRGSLAEAAACYDCAM